MNISKNAKNRSSDEGNKKIKKFSFNGYEKAKYLQSSTILVVLKTTWVIN